MKNRFLNSLNRNTFLFIAGLLGVAHETLLSHAERPTLLILFAAMMGLPAFLTELAPRQDKKNKDDDSKSDKPKGDEHGTE